MQEDARLAVRTRLRQHFVPVYFSIVSSHVSQGCVLDLFQDVDQSYIQQLLQRPESDLSEDLVK